MVTLCTYQDVIDRCGVDADATIIASQAIVERYIEDAEQTICAETNINWIGGYTSVIDSVKSTLTLCTASHAAKEIVAQNAKGYIPSTAWITTLNVLENTFQRTLKALKNVDINKIRSVKT